LIFFIILNFTKDKNVQLRNIPNFYTSVGALIYKDDFAFINKDYQDFIIYYDKLTKNHECITVVTIDNSIPYFLNKPTCSKYYISYISSPEYIQNKFVNEISVKKPVYIAYGKHPKLDIVKKYILQNYSFFKKINKWTIYRIK
jgi:hypothetical protein